MNKPLSEKEKLITMLTGIYDQLEELELVLEASFSDLRINLNKEEQDKLKEQQQKLSVIDQTIEKIKPFLIKKLLAPTQTKYQEHSSLN